MMGIKKGYFSHLPKHDELEDSGWVRWEESPATQQNLTL